MQTDDIEPLEYCDKNFDKTPENLKLLLQMSYLIPSVIFQLRVIYVIKWKYRKKFQKQSFFTIFLADCITGFLLVLSSIFFSRPAMYLPQSCEFLLQFLESHVFILHIYYPFLRYLQAFQILLQMLFIANRASCVIWPMDYCIFWGKYLRRILLILSGLPMLWIWTVAISEKVVRHAYGGLFVTYNRYYSWARTSTFFAILRGFSVIFIGISTIVTVIKMTRMKNRIKESERKLCWASVYLSICYIAPFQYSRTAHLLSNSDVLYGLIVISWDIQNIGSTFVMLIMNVPFRRYVFSTSKSYSSWKEKKKKIIQVTSMTTNYVLGAA